MTLPINHQIHQSEHWQIISSKSLGNAHNIVWLTSEIFQVGILHTGGRTLINLRVQLLLIYLGATNQRNYEKKQKHSHDDSSVLV
jgi:hypothetical protein